MPTVRETVWASTLAAAERAALDPGVPEELDRRPDVLVVGGGALGLATAAACRRAGVERVVVIEAGPLAGGASGGAGGVLAPDVHALREDRSAFVALARRSLALHRDLDTGLQRRDILVLGPDGLVPPPQDVHAEVLDTDGVAVLEPDLSPQAGGLLVLDQAWVHPLRLALALASAAGMVATGVAMTGVRVSNGRIVTVDTTAGPFQPGHVVFATGLAPPGVVHLPQEWAKGHLVALTPGPYRLRCGIDSPDVGLGPLDGGGVLAGGTTDVGDASPEVRDDVVARIRDRLAGLLPAAATAEITHRWCCFRPATADRQPVIDRVPGVDNAWVTAGHYRTGILLAPATAEALASWITTGVQPDGVAPFSVSRFR